MKEGKIQCPECGGTGIVDDIGCCGNVTKYGSCCGNGIPVPKPCEYCQAEGFIPCEIPHLHNYEITYYGDCTGCNSKEKLT